MKKSILLIFSIAFALVLSSCQSATVTDKNSITEELSKSSILTQTKTVDKENFSDQTNAVDKDELANTTNKDLNFEEIYDNFLSGQTYAIDKDGQQRSINYYLDLDSTAPEDIREYAVYDMNGDAIPELMVRSRISLNIFWIYNNELTLWHSDVSYAKPLNNMALLYERASGGPEHTDHQYIVLGYQGDELYKINFSEYSNVEVNGIQYDNKYFIDDTEVTKGIYDSLSERFLNIGDDNIEWKAIPN